MPDHSRIGLALCHKILEGYGGSMTAKNRLNVGSKFIITLPVNH
ncbi:MAG: hypothetical protein ACLGPL_09165 [Acidobacteriota bacterium]